MSSITSLPYPQGGMASLSSRASHPASAFYAAPTTLYGAGPKGTAEQWQAESRFNSSPQELKPQFPKADTGLAKATPSINREKLRQYLPLAGLLLTNAILLKRLPARSRPGGSLLPTDWKVWAKVGLGIFSVSNLNKAFDWQPPPWLAGMETASVIHTLTSGISRHSLGQLMVIAPLVAGTVQAASTLHKTVGQELKDEYGVSTLVSRLAISAGMVFLGAKLLPKLHQPLMNHPLFQKIFPKPQLSKSGSVLASTMVTCARGCTPGGVICLSEIAELTGAMGSWFKSPNGQNSARKGQSQ